MKHSSLKFLVTFLFSLFCFSNIFSLNLTGKIENLGSPFAYLYPSGEKIYARNIWTLQAYQGSIFIGGGNSSNEGPAQNAGPVPVYRYDPAKNMFIKEFTVQEEQIDTYYVFQNHLLVPGHDATENWHFGNLYIRNPKGLWTKKRNLNNGLHVYSIFHYQNRLYCGIKQKKGSAVAVSSDLGQTWAITNIIYPRIFSFFRLDKKLYHLTEIKVNAKNPLFEHVSATRFYHRRDVFNANIFPGVYLHKRFGNKMLKSTTLKNRLIYIGAHSHNDHQSRPFGVFIAESLKKRNLSVKKVELPEGEVPWDLKQREGKIYLLTAKKGPYKTKISIFLLDESLNNFKRSFYFYSSTFARSFEILKGDFYFGLGCEVESTKNWKQSELVPETGEILRLKSSSLKQKTNRKHFRSKPKSIQDKF